MCVTVGSAIACDRLRLYGNNFSLRSSAICDPRSSAIACDHMETSLKEKISGKGHFFDDLSDYKFINVPSWICSELKNVFLRALGFHFFYPRRSRPRTSFKWYRGLSVAEYLLQRSQTSSTWSRVIPPSGSLRGRRRRGGKEKKTSARSAWAWGVALRCSTKTQMLMSIYRTYRPTISLSSRN